MIKVLTSNLTLEFSRKSLETIPQSANWSWQLENPIQSPHKAGRDFRTPPTCVTIFSRLATEAKKATVIK